MKKELAAAFVFILLAGCTSKTVTPSPATSIKPIVQTRLSHTIYFEFDSSDVSSEYLDVIASHAAYLKDNPNRNLLLQGTADNEGVKSYNYNLGMLRANAVAELLLKAGVSDGQIRVSSIGDLGADSNRPLGEHRRVTFNY